MSVTAPARERLVISGRPMSEPLRGARRLAQQMVGHFVEAVAPCGTLPGDLVRGEVTIVTSHCLEIVVGMLDGGPAPDKIARLEQAAAGWAREGVPLDTILHAVHAGFRMGLDLVTTTGRDRTEAVRADDFDNLAECVKLLVDALDVMTTTITLAYIREMRVVATEHHTATHTLTSALLGGHATSVMARQCGIDVAERYTVLALHIPPHPDESNPVVDAQVVARRKLRRVQAELALCCGRKALALLSVEGGTLLLPTRDIAEDQLDGVIARLSEAGRVPVTATAVAATTAEIPDAAERAHQLLDTIVRAGSPSGVFRFDRMAVEYQLSRPGPARDSLAAVLEPLDGHPELLETLRVHVATELNRQQTARRLGLHANTVDYRLKKIAQLTGHDPSSGTGMWQLRAALIARGHQTASYATPDR
ncbi:PucR family transcriptional regulator [Nocardia bovistercoris]|uniref:Helix-turn-helix domain-containing protein n=1 Tax=Nocardia bovistercoris TaxID=2785916 RepID=A0A931IC73_9NOCA|nr:helix-turn-helix domain-containing protein [Nocardia bovistercoris]MBH0778406.1 helix-turn-helix domain-containing protein [Nocardia bovistercoris]